MEPPPDPGRFNAHKRSHTIVAVDEHGAVLATATFKTTTAAHLDALRWAAGLAAERRWAVEDCRHLSRRLEQDLLAGGESVVRVPPKLMAKVRDSARTYGKSDPIDATAVARAALREPNLPVACLDGPEREVRLLVDYRETLVGERIALISRLRWRLHELDPELDPTPRSLDRVTNLNRLEASIADLGGTVARLARCDIARLRELAVAINQLETEIAELAGVLAPNLLAVVGVGPLAAAKIVGQTAGVDRFRNADAFARYNGTAPLPVWSSGTPRHRLSRVGNRQLNTAIHLVALCQIRVHEPAKDLYQRRRSNGDGGLEALRVLKRHLSNVIYNAMIADQKARTALAA